MSACEGDVPVAVRRTDDGFTLVELLVVVLILGILAAIAIPAYLNQRNAAVQAAAVSNLRAAEIAARAELAENEAFEPWTNRGVLDFLRDAVPELTWTRNRRIDEQDTIAIRRRNTPGARSVTFMAFAGGDCRYVRVYEDGRVERHIEAINANTGRCHSDAFQRTEDPSGW